MTDLNALLVQRTLLFDGGTGSLLVERGLRAGEKPETWNLLHPDVIESLHTAYIEAGADIIKSNTFGAYRHKLGDDTERIIKEALAIARKASDKAGKGTLVALDLGPTGKLIEPFGDLPFEEAVAIFAESVKVGAPYADLVLIETMSDLYELKAAILAAKENCNLPIVATVALEERGRIMTGADLTTIASLLEGLGVAALGVNCGFGPATLAPFVKELCRVTSIPLVVNPNAGLPTIRDGKTCYDLTPQRFADEMKALYTEGIALMGGCCGTTPEHIRLLKALAEEVGAPRLADKGVTAVTSYKDALVLGKTACVLGERLNAKKNPALAEALSEGDLFTVEDEGLDQTDEGAMLLEVSAAKDTPDEVETLYTMVKALQEICTTPLALCSTDPVALEKACRIYNGKPLVAVEADGKTDLDGIFVVAKKYGAVVAITLQGKNCRSEVQKKAKAAGIAEKDLLFDPMDAGVFTAL